MSELRFKNTKAATKWLSDNLGMYWEENDEKGRYGVCVPPENIKDDPFFTYADTVLEAIEEMAELIEK